LQLNLFRKPRFRTVAFVDLVQNSTPEAERSTERYRTEFRAETLAEARHLIKEEGWEGLTLRKLAQRMQCSPMALYTYFADKQALLTALALEGFKNLAKRHGGTSRRDP
jgi:AcrR family transcriptional regulator